MFGESKEEKEEFHIINRLLGIVANRTHQNHHGHRPPHSTALKANYLTVDKSGNIIFHNSNNNLMAQTITVLGTQNTVPGQLVPVAADNVTVEPISTIQASRRRHTRYWRDW